jgi:asparagine synthase (glutamine-hydrolysing)
VGSQSIFSSAERNHLLNGRGEDAGPIPLVLQDSFNKARNWNFCHQLQYVDLKHYLPNALLAKVDVASMYHGLEVRVPLLDHHVVELAARIPATLNLQRNVSSSSLGGKLLLKRVAEQFYDREFVNRPKMGFAAPIRHWFHEDRLGDLQDRLLDPGSRMGELFSRQAIEQVVTTQRETGGASRRLWLLMFLAEWMQQHQQVGIG